MRSIWQLSWAFLRGSQDSKSIFNYDIWICRDSKNPISRLQLGLPNQYRKRHYGRINDQCQFKRDMIVFSSGSAKENKQELYGHYPWTIATLLPPLAFFGRQMGNKSSSSLPPQRHLSGYDYQPKMFHWKVRKVTLIIWKRKECRVYFLITNPNISFASSVVTNSSGWMFHYQSEKFHNQLENRKIGACALSRHTPNRQGNQTYQ